MTVTQTVRLRDVADINPKLKVTPPLDSPVAFVPMAAVDALTGTLEPEERLFGELSKGLTPFLDGDVLIAKITPCFENGKIAQARLQHPLGIGSTEFHVVRAHPDQADSRYLLHFLRQERVLRIGEARMTGSAGQRRVPPEFIAEIEIPLPPLLEQQRIAAILDQADALRAKRRAALAELETLTQSIFVEMFGDPTTNPKRWPLLAFKEACKEINDCPHSTPRWTSSGVICLRTSNLLKGEWSWNDSRYVTEAAYHARSKRGYLKSGDIVISREGTVGIAAILPDGVEACMGQRLVQIRTSRNMLEPSYLLQHLLHVLEPRRIASSLVGSTSHHLNLTALRAMMIPMPPIEDQSQFSRRVDEIRRLRRASQESLTSLDSLFSSLQHRAFRGEL